MRIAPDSNILVRAATSTAGPASRLLDLLLRLHTVVLSHAILDEVRRVLLYPRIQLRYHVDSAAVELFFARLEASADFVEPVVERPVVLTDPSDDLVLFTAVTGRADVLCTLNKHDFGAPNVQAFCAARGIRVLSDVELLRELTGQEQAGASDRSVYAPYNKVMSATVLTPPAPDVLAKYEPVIGLEVHVQLGTRTKIYCACPTSFAAPPNTNVCPVCLGLPGALPVLNRVAVEMAIKAALALHCRVNPFSRLARKNYFYPDLPKGYQISQYDQPLAEHGHLDIRLEDGSTKRIGVTRVHIEDDAGKSLHEGYKDTDRYSYVDLNRSGTPLIEIVSEPDIRTGEEATAYLTELKLAMQFLDVSSCDMEKGHLRADANVSVRLRGAEKFGTKTEVKNVNSFRFIRQAIDFEIQRQIALIESGGTVRQETRLYNPNLNETFVMRTKEQAHDYRYFPEPDLVPLRVSERWLGEVRSTMPELPAQRRARLTGSFGLREYDAQVLTLSRELSDYYELAAAASGDPKEAAKWVMGDLMAALNEAGKEITESPVSPEKLGELVALVRSGEVTGKLAKEIFPKMVATGDSARTIMEREGLRAIGGGDELGRIVEEVVKGNTKQVEQYKAGKKAVMGFLVGQVMKATRGQADPAAVNQILTEQLGG